MHLSGPIFKMSTHTFRKTLVRFQGQSIFAPIRLLLFLENFKFQLTNEIYQLKITCPKCPLSSTFPRVTDICANQIAPFLSRSLCVREIEKVKSEKLKTKPKYRNVTRFSKLLRSALQSSFAELRFAKMCTM